MNGKFYQISHPLLEHKLSYLRDKKTNSFEFREIVKEISKLLAYEAMKDWDQFETYKIETPIAKTEVRKISNGPIVACIMRAGNGMLDAVLDIIPFASAGHIGIYRDKFINNTVEYYFKLPQDCKGRQILVCDPLIATADTMVAAIERLKNYEVGRIKVLSILVSASGLEKIFKYHPDVDVYALGMEKELTKEGYLVPG